jgi:hypothetical protein
MYLVRSTRTSVPVPSSAPTRAVVSPVRFALPGIGRALDLARVVEEFVGPLSALPLDAVEERDVVFVDLR